MFIQYHEMAQILFHILIAMCRNIQDSITLYIITLKTSSKRRKFENANVRINRHWIDLFYKFWHMLCYCLHYAPLSWLLLNKSAIWYSEPWGVHHGASRPAQNTNTCVYMEATNMSTHLDILCKVIEMSLSYL